MTEDEKQTSEETQPEQPQDEDAQSAGPVAEETSEAEQPEDDAAAEESEAAPAAEQEDEPEAVAEETSEEVASEEPAAEEPEEAPAQESKAKEPEAKKDKKDVIPGADLEPIAVDSAEERPLSAEERARREAEEEERAQREAELAGDGEETDSADRAPAKMESGSRFQATGKRKRSIARVTLLPGAGKFEINGRTLEEFFPRPLHQTMAKQALTTTGYETSVDVRIRVHGGGIGGQAGAVRHGISRALTEIDPELRGELKRRGYLTRDSRVKERRKAGLKKARKRPQFSKR